MKFTPATARILAAALALLCAAVLSHGALRPMVARPQASVAQKAVAQTQFPPLEKWKAAVLSGNAAALQSLYSADPPAVTKTPGGTSSNPAVEAAFWSQLKSSGLARLKTKIVYLDSPQGGVLRVIFTLEADLRTPSGSEKRFASIAQNWIEQNGQPVIFATQRSNLARLPQPIESKPNLYPDPAEARTDIGVALSVAAREHRRVLLDFGGNWCYDCHVLDATFHYPDVAKILEPNFIVVHINIGQYDKNLDLAAKYQIPLKKGVPGLAVLDSSGKLLVSQEQGDFENTTKIGLKDVENFLNRWKPLTKISRSPSRVQ
jgi:thioredoxin 1